jgi:ATP-binding cassette subfamily F protein 3
VEERMATLNTEGAELEGKLSTNPHPSVIAETGKRLKAVNSELQTLEEQWLALTTQMEG